MGWGWGASSLLEAFSVCNSGRGLILNFSNTSNEQSTQVTLIHTRHEIILYFTLVGSHHISENITAVKDNESRRNKQKYTTQKST